ncbi:MAG: DUF11 domain-containing protein, partial [Gemmatimonadetes bacterium]|nr:DUF11 domain-containing protein [Gemmatimonadota bacterium]
MRNLVKRMAQGRGGRRPAIFAGRWLAAVLLLGSVPAAAQGGGTVPDSSKLENRAYLSYQDGNGVTGSSTAVASVLLERSAGVVVTPPYDVVMTPGERRVLAHRVVSQEAGADHFRMEVAGPAGWRTTLYRDLDGDGALGPGDLQVTAPIDLRSGEGAALLLVIDVPDDYTGSGGPVELRATSTTNDGITGSALDRVTVRRASIAAALAKTVDRSEATAGDTLRYTLILSNRGEGALPGAVIRDPLPVGVRFLAGSLRLNGALLTDAADSDAGTVERDAAGGETVRVRPATLLPAASATVTFGVVVQAGAPEGSLVNVAGLSYAGLTGEVTSPPAETRVSQGKLELTKERLGSDTVRTGGQVVYRLGYANRSAVAIRDLVLVDTLPAELVYVSADGSPEVSGQVLRWRIGTLAPGTSGALNVTTRAVLPAGSRATVVNRVVAQGASAVAATAESTPLEVLPLSGDELEIRKRVGVLEGGVGEAVPYTVTVRNRGEVPIGGIVVHDRLPAGLRFVADGVVGADSVAIDGQEVRFFVAGPLAPGQERTVRYAATLIAPGGGTALGNRAWAEAEQGRVRTDTATAWVRMRRGFAMQERTLIGKVWLDENGDGVQQAGEKGVPGVNVWSAAGEVVTTDRQGRFSFRNLRPGTQLVRLDTIGLPGGYAIARNGDDMVQVRMDGWTTPRASFRLVRRLPSSDWEQVRVAGKGATGPTPTSDGDKGGDENTVEVRARRLPPRVPPLRTDEEREAEERNSLIEGPEVRIFAPTDGTVIGTNRLFVGVRGEAGAPVKLYDGEKLLREATLRPDGVWDFIGIDIAPGPHHLRVWMRNSWQKERWDSVAVHRSGEPASFEMPARSLTLRSEAAAERLRVRVLDAWKVPVADSPNVTVAVRGAAVTSPDVDASSVGMQVRTELDGWMEISLKGGHEVGPGEMLLSYQKLRGRVPLRVLPIVRPIIATGIGQVGVGAAPGAFGAMTIKGAIGSETSVSLNYDSRRSDPDNDFFAGGYDPLEESRYPTVGDQSQGRNLGSATQVLSARVERGFDWLEFGDVQTAGFGGGDRLSAYNRFLTGVSGRMTTGAVVWHGFGSVTDQSLDQRQLRGDGTSGPYRVGGAIRPGTERVAIEVRARENAARVVARQELARFTDYQVDYETGYILLQRAVPATDPQGNPVFVVATVERRSGGDSRFVGGLRMEMDASQLLKVRGVDSLGVGVFGIRDAAGQNYRLGLAQGPAVGYDLFGGDLRVRRRGLEAGVEMIRSVRPDSSATATQAQLSWTMAGDRARMEAGWLRVGDGFSAAANPRLASGL